MDRETNLAPIRVLERQIDEHEKAAIKLKRTRNSSLNVSVLLPPIILGRIFRWNVVSDGDFGGFSKGSYNFLLVCHRWFGVVSHAPELWCSWGNSIRIGCISMLIVRLLRSTWCWGGIWAASWMANYVMHSRTVLYGTPYDGFTSEVSTKQNFSTPSSLQ